MDIEIKKTVEICHCHHCHLCQVGSFEDRQKRRISEPVRIGQIFPFVMRDIEKRVQRHHRVEVGIDIADYTIKE